MERCVNPECQREGLIIGRGLCKPCYYTPAIRERTPKRHIGGYVRREYHEPTMAELDALIAERLPTMPTGNDDGMADTPTAIKRRIKSKNRR